MRYKTLLGCFVVSSFILLIAGNGSAQSVFRLGAWCFRPTTAPPQPIYQLPSGEWRVRTNERDKLLNLGLNYFIACTGLNAEFSWATHLIRHQHPRVLNPPWVWSRHLLNFCHGA